MSKTSPIVIPVLVDTTGVDRGMNNVRNRLRGASGTQGGFGSGGRASQGVGQAGSGGGALTGLAAAAVASNVAGRQIGRSVRKEFKTSFEMLRDRFGASTRITGANQQAIYGTATDARTGRKTHFKINRERQMELADLRERTLADLYDLQERRRAKTIMGRMKKQGRLLRGEMTGLMPDRATREQFLKTMMGRFGVPEAAGGRIAAGLGGVGGMIGLGVGGALIGGAAAARFQQAQYNRFANFEQYEGTQYYGIARRAAMGYDKSAGIDWYTKMMMREKEAGGMFSGMLEGVGTVFSRGAELVGAVLGGGIQPNITGATRAYNIIFGNTVRSAN